MSNFNFFSGRSNRATEAVSALQKLHTSKKRSPVAHSLFLDQILAFSGGSFRGENFVGDRLVTSSMATTAGKVSGVTVAGDGAGIGGGSTAIGSMARVVEERIMSTIAESKVGRLIFTFR